MAANMLTAYYSRGCDSFEYVKFFEQDTSSIADDCLCHKSVGSRDLFRVYSDVEYLDEIILSFVLNNVYQSCRIPFVIIIDEWDYIFISKKKYKE